MWVSLTVLIDQTCIEQDMQQRMVRLRQVLMLIFITLLTLYLLSTRLTSIDLRPQTLLGNIFPPTGNQDVGTSRKEIVLHLRLITEQLSSALALKNPPSLRTIQSLQRIIEDLEPSFASNTSNALSNSVVEVCPGYYTNSTYGYPFYFEGWKRTDCGDVPSLDTLISIVLNPDEKCSHLKWILDGIREDYPTLHVFVSERYKCVEEFRKYSKVHLVPVPFSASQGEVWNSLVAEVQTKYVFVGRGLFHFNSFVDLERQIEVMGIDSRVSVVGGAIRNMSEHWHVGCLQFSMYNYVLEYQEGYHASRNDCMFCDYLLSPFTAKTEVLKKIQFDASLSSSVLFEDLFLRLQQGKKHFVMNCPDVMYFKTSSEFVRTKESWMDLAKKWSLNRIAPTRNAMYHYSCDESGISCTYLYTTTKAYLMPICCIEQQYKRAIAFLQELVEKHNVRVELDCGSVLGAVKFQGMIPWDIDADISYSSENHTYLEQHKAMFAGLGFELETVEKAVTSSKTGQSSGGYFKLHTPHSIVELYGVSKLSADVPKALPKGIARKSTKVNMNGIWVGAPANPGLYVRNRYRSSYLKHAQSWRHIGAKSSWINYEIGNFMPCPRLNHHACLDRFLTDGNIQFQIP